MKIENTTAIAEVEATRASTPSERILQPLGLSDYSQFLYSKKKERCSSPHERTGFPHRRT